MAKLFKQFHNMKEYEASKISFTKDNSSYVYGTDFSKVYTAGDDKSDIVSYNTICFIDESKEIFRNCANYSGLGKYAYMPEGSYLEVNKDAYIHTGVMITSAKSTVTPGTSNTTYISGKQIVIDGVISNQAYSGIAKINNNGFNFNAVSQDGTSYYSYANIVANSNGGTLKLANYGINGSTQYTTPDKSIEVGFKNNTNYGIGVSSYDSTYVVGSQYNFYKVGDTTSYQYNKITPLDDNNQVNQMYLTDHTSYLMSYLKYFPYDYKSNDGVWWNLNNKVLTMSNGVDTSTNLQFGFYDNTPYIIFHSNNVETLKFTPDGCWINYFGTKYKMNFNKMIELGILEKA